MKNKKLESYNAWYDYFIELNDGASILDEVSMQAAAWVMVGLNKPVPKKTHG